MSIYTKTSPPYYPFSRPIKGNIDGMCSNPTDYGCKYQAECDTGFKPVLDCGQNTNMVCCPENMFPYKSEEYCTFLRDQTCFTKDGSCPPDTMPVNECNMCCPNGISNNMNFSDTPYIPSTMSKIGNKWNKDFAIIPDGLYEIGYSSDKCIIGSSLTDVTLYDPLSNISGGSCGNTWTITNVNEWYEPIQKYPANDTSYISGGFTVYNNVLRKYLSVAQDNFSRNYKLKLVQEPTSVAIFKNEDDSYRIMNSKNNIRSLYDIGNIGNPLKCIVVNQDNSIGSYNWGHGNVGIPCGINKETDQPNYKFKINRVAGNTPVNIPAVIADGEYYFQVVGTDKCLIDNNTMLSSGNKYLTNGQYGPVGACGVANGRLVHSPEFKWTLRNVQGGFTLRNVLTSKYLSLPLYSSPTVNTSTDNIVNIYKNADGVTVRFEKNKICIKNDDFTGYNWNISTGECGTGPGSTISEYKFKYVPVDNTFPQVSIIEEGIYKIYDVADNSTIYDNTDSYRFTRIESDPEYTNLIQVTSLRPWDSTFDKTIWIITKAKDSDGNDGYTIKNQYSNRYISIGDTYDMVHTGDYFCNTCIKLTTVGSPTVVYIYKNDDDTISIQNSKGICLTRQVYYGLEAAHVTFEPYYGFQDPSKNCGITDATINHKFKLVKKPPPPPAYSFSGSSGTCNISWKNLWDDTRVTYYYNLSSKISCDNSYTDLVNKSSEYQLGEISYDWAPLYSGSTAIYTYSGGCMTVDNNNNVMIGTECKIPEDLTGRLISGNYPFIWDFNPNPDGTYKIQNNFNNNYLTIPDTASNTGLKTSSVPEDINVDMTISPDKSEYYMRLTTTGRNEVCAYTDNINVSSVSWSNRLTDSSTKYECGADVNDIIDINPNYDTPNVNYRFTVDNFNFMGNTYSNDGSNTTRPSTSPPIRPTFAPIAPLVPSESFFTGANNKTWTTRFDSATTTGKCIYDLRNMTFMSEANYGLLLKYQINNGLLPVDNPFKDVIETPVQSASGINARIILSLNLSKYGGKNPFKRGDPIYVFGIQGNTAANTDASKSTSGFPVMYVYSTYPDRFVKQNQILISYTNPEPGQNNTLLGSGNYISGGTVRMANQTFDQKLLMYSAYLHTIGQTLNWPNYDITSTEAFNVYRSNYTNYLSWLNNVFIDVIYSCTKLSTIWSFGRTFVNGPATVTTSGSGSGMTVNLLGTPFMGSYVYFSQITNYGTGYNDGDSLTIEQNGNTATVSIDSSGCNRQNNPQFLDLSSSMTEPQITELIAYASRLDDSINTIVLQSGANITDPENYGNSNLKIGFCISNLDDKYDIKNDICNCTTTQDISQTIIQTIFPNKIDQCANQIISTTGVNSNLFSSDTDCDVMGCQ